jgi:hypothetical protein
MITLTGIGALTVFILCIILDAACLFGMLALICKSKALITGYMFTTIQATKVLLYIACAYILVAFATWTPGMLILKYFGLFPIV